MEKELVPALRFKGYTDTWGQRKLGDIATFINGRAYKQEELLETGKYKVLRVGNFYTNDTWYYSNLEMDEKYYANYGDLLYTWSATFGPHIWLGEKVIYHYHIWKIELSDVVDKQFIVQLLEQDRTNILSTYNGSTMIHVTKSDMEQKQVFIPSILEQRKVGSYLKRIDALLTLHQRKFEKLQNIKKSLLQKMFPAEGEDVPAVRFAGVTAPWKQHKLGELCDNFQSGKFIKAIEINDRGRFPVFGGNGLRGFTDRFNYDGEFAIIGRQGALCGNVILVSGKSYFTEHAIVVRANHQNITRFLYYVLGKMELGQYSDQSAQPGLAVKKLMNLNTFVPLSKEQLCISKFLYKLDILITLHQREIERLQKIKLAALQKMFV